MKNLFAACVLALTVGVETSAHAEGLFYQLPKDGSWAEYTIDGVGTNPDDTEVTLRGTVKMSSVGKVQVEGKPCRWIELRTEGKRNDDKFTDTVKLLIPEKHLAKGQDPLGHVIKAWKDHHRSQAAR